MNYYEKSLKAHEEWAGKISVELKCKLETQEDLSIAYTPGVAQPCLEIEKNPEDPKVKSLMEIKLLLEKNKEGEDDE